MRLRRIMRCQDCGQRVVKEPLTGGVFTDTFLEGFKVWTHRDFRVGGLDERRHAYVGGIQPWFDGFELVRKEKVR